MSSQDYSHVNNLKEAKKVLQRIRAKDVNANQWYEIQKALLSIEESIRMEKYNE